MPLSLSITLTVVALLYVPLVVIIRWPDSEDDYYETIHESRVKNGFPI